MTLDRLGTGSGTGDCGNAARERATELEYLRWFRMKADFGPADGDVKEMLNDFFMEETGKNLPEGWNIGQDGETCLDV